MSSELQDNLPSPISIVGRGGSGNGDPTHSPPAAILRGTISSSALQLWRNRGFIAKAAAVGLVVATLIAFRFPPTFESTTRLMPPDKHGTAGLASLRTAATVAGNLSTVPLIGEALGASSGGALMVAVLRSRTVQDHIVEQFDLTKVYRAHYLKDACERLSSSTEITLDQKSGIITIIVTDKSPQRARDIARAYAVELNHLLAELDTSAARKERLFIEERLQTVKADMDDAAQQLARYSSENTTLDIKEQTRAMVESAAKLQGELIAAQAELRGLEQIYTDNSARVRAMRARVAELQRQIGNMNGTSTSLGDAVNANAPYPSIRKLPLLGVPYADLLRRLTIQEAIYETLTKQYEAAKIQEARDIPTIRVLDPANVPERKSSPKRSLIVALGTYFAGFLGIMYVLISERWQTLEPDHPIKFLTREMQQGLAQDYQTFRARIPWSRNGANSSENK